MTTRMKKPDLNEIVARPSSLVPALSLSDIGIVWYQRRSSIVERCTDEVSGLSEGREGERESKKGGGPKLHDMGWDDETVRDSVIYTIRSSCSAPASVFHASGNPSRFNIRELRQRGPLDCQRMGHCSKHRDQENVHHPFRAMSSNIVNVPCSSSPVEKCI